MLLLGTKRGRWAAALVVLLGGIVLVWAGTEACLSTWLFQGVKLSTCPEGRLRQTVGVSGEALAREGEGLVTVWAEAHGTGKAPGQLLQAPVRRLEAELFLVDAEGKEQPLATEGSWKERGDFHRQARVKLPALPDGDWRLRARLSSPLGQESVEAALPLYAPARVHVLTDRPLYEPGHRVRFRALVLRARDLAPLDGRPGTWVVTDPSGEVVLEERVSAGDWGVVAGDLPLDRGAPTGTWRVSWQSGGSSGEASFQVQPFTLPRMRVEAQSARPFWRAGEQPMLEGQVVYTSGAPVAEARVEVGWRHGGAWPPPPEWLATALPTKAQTDGAGRFRLTLPRVPEDLRGQATLTALLTAHDPAGDSVQGSASVLLAEEALAVSAVTELEDGLVESYSNRVYLRATTPDGRVLPGAELTLRRAWDPRDEGIRAVADEDGVAAFQLDPGPPVNVVLPPMPVRRHPRPSPVSLSGVEDLLSGGEPRLEDQLAVERWLPALEPCARFVSPDEGGVETTLAVSVSGGGAVVDVASASSRLNACLAQALRARTLPSGPERLLSLSLQVAEPGLPTLSFEVREVLGTGSSLLSEVLQGAALDARACLPADLSESKPLPAALTWRLRAGRGAVDTRWAALPREEGMLAAGSAACIQSRLGSLELPESLVARGTEEETAPQEDMGMVRFTAEPASSEGSEGSEEAPQATTLLGYELRVSARAQGEEVGSAKLVLRPAQLPPVRLRATPVLVRAGEEVRVELIRGPDFRGELPKELVMEAGSAAWVSKVEKPGRVARFQLPADFEGWAEVSWSGAVARVYAAPRARLSVEVVPDKPTYAPGALAHLQLRTRVDGKGGAAAVGLFGVDESLGQLAALPGADALDGMRLVPTVAAPAFGVLDGAALAMGRIRGANAAAAALLRVSAVPRPELSEPRVAVSGHTAFDPEVELTEPFYAVLAELTAQVRAWESSAPEGETMSPATLARLWARALEACEKRGEPVRDAYGRHLRLSRLPPELLAMTDPRAVVVSGTRLPEDVESWDAWVAREEP